MGRRKERRIAANAGRRVKLDLFAEPSGDVGSSSAQEEVGGEGDSKTPAELPSSPSSSAHEQQNPLLLLEQYSDEELDADSNEMHNRAVSEDASIDIDDEAKRAARGETEDAENTAGYPTIEKVDPGVNNGSAFQDQLQKLESITEIDSDDTQKGTQKMEEATYTTATDEQLVGDAGSGWKMVLHEETNQYYYWNIVTGETSWEVPDVLAQETVTSVDKAVGDTEVIRDGVNVDMEEDDISSRKPNTDFKDNSQASDIADQLTKMDGSKEGSKGDSIDNEEGIRDANQNHETSLLGRHSGESESVTDLSLQLGKHCESLLERLNCMERLNCYQEGQDLKLKYTLEIETRLADIKALASHGSSVLPFWLHSEYRLEQLEAAIADIIQHQSSASATKFEATVESREGIGDEIGSSENKPVFHVVESHAPEYTEKSSFDAHNDGATTTEHVPLVCYSSMSPVNNLGGKSEINGSEKESDSSPRPALHSGEEVDMDVDMEVEDTFTSTKSPNEASHYNVSTGIPNLQNTLADQEPTVPGQAYSTLPVGEWIPPPPPDNEPFPPPPPDDEPFPPPPPPDEPPEISYAPSSNLESVQPFLYSEQYHLSYPTVSNVYAVAPLVVNPRTFSRYVTTELVSVPSTSDNPASVSVAVATTSKVQSKVPRGKKRAVAVVSTLRSNKKVSSLVDKWKAAKEELHEEEEEPEDAHEILEKKRQREIEEWRVHQIASGEAKDNPNFQPLGGDCNVAHAYSLFSARLTYLASLWSSTPFFNLISLNSQKVFRLDGRYSSSSMKDEVKLPGLDLRISWSRAQLNLNIPEHVDDIEEELESCRREFGEGSKSNSLIDGHGASNSTAHALAHRWYPHITTMRTRECKWRNYSKSIGMATDPGWPQNRPDKCLMMRTLRSEMTLTVVVLRRRLSLATPQPAPVMAHCLHQQTAS
ncbi:hypothetical protein BUALT_Bualt03G0102900 [Buddleja alternifolia]|uniref:WW domain-containing protein n=1 Tax=Buddleja alternifolia TaxID=168488 RepID=A0AAV6XSY2_9LAMI|nr:hypothetical protein BUALT_Bualt03G0102900 [Buddleja alternifolia]